MEKIPVIAVCGPTASGKTELGTEIASAFKGQVISADSMQVYRRLDIGTAKPDIEERRGIVHRMIDILEPWESFSVADYCQRAAKEIQITLEEGCIPVIVGGTGLYIDNLIANTDFSSPGGDEEIRSRLLTQAREEGNDALYRRLRRLDPQAAEKVHPNNLKRIIRSLELLELTGESRGSLDEKSRRPSPYRALWLAIDCDRTQLYEKIDKRVDIMINKGLEAEVRRELLPIRDRAVTAGQAIGYKEMLEYIDGKLTLNQAVEKIKQNSRRYAKRQLTWFKRNKEINWLSSQDPWGEAGEIIKNFLNKETIS